MPDIADNGYLLCQPNNRIFWKDSNWITIPFPIEKQNIKVDTELKSVESVSDRWISEETDCFYYEISKVEQKRDNKNYLNEDNCRV